jgi:hypothetical protein
MTDIKWDDIEAFTDKGRRSNRNECVINKNGIITIATKLLDADLNKDKAKKDCVNLFFSKKNNAILMQFVPGWIGNTEASNIRLILGYETDPTFSFRALNFLKVHNIILPEKTKKYPIFYEEINNKYWFVIRL